MAFGALLYALGFSMFGFFGAYVFFAAAMIIITIGEMLIAPVAQSLVASFAPEDMRGRYMAVNGLVWIVPFAIGPLGAGLIMDHFDPRLMWFVAGIIGLVAVCGYLWLHVKAGKKFEARQNGNRKHKLVVETEPSVALK